MPQYLAPGVYVEEVPSAVQPIAGVGTSTAGFVGVVEDGIRMPAKPGQFEMESDKVKEDEDGNPIPKLYELAPAKEPRLLTSWESFKTTFGDINEENRNLAHAVYGFFNNGGTRCWVARVGKLDATNVGEVLNLFKAIDEIAIVAVPGATSEEIVTKVTAHCENTQDRFAVLDGVQDPSELTPAEINPAGTSGYAALYFPWIEVYDPATAATITVPPSGHIAGVYARVDAQRGVHKAPANEVIRGALGVERRVSRADQEGLNPAGINVIRLFNDTPTIWGGRTLGGDANGEWKYISTRRFFNFLRESIDEGTRWVVFEPNTPALWAKIRRNISAFLQTVWASGALFGATAEEAFYVRCDETTNPPAVREQGQVVTEIGVAIVRPAEFVVFRVSQWAGPGE